MLTTLVVLLAAATIAVPLTRRAGFGSVLGYLLAGVAIGPAGLGLITDVEQIAAISELGVVMLLFLIGLELRPHRLWVMRQVGVRPGHRRRWCSTGAVLAVLAHLAGVGWPGAVGAGRRPRPVLHRHRAADARPSGTCWPAAAGRDASRCCCSRTSPSFRWWHWCRCWPASAMPDQRALA